MSLSPLSGSQNPCSIFTECDCLFWDHCGGICRLLCGVCRGGSGARPEWGLPCCVEAVLDTYDVRLSHLGPLQLCLTLAGPWVCCGQLTGCFCQGSEKSEVRIGRDMEVNTGAHRRDRQSDV